MLRNSQAKHVDSTVVPNIDDVVHMHHSLGGDLTLFSEFGSGFAETKGRRALS